MKRFLLIGILLAIAGATLFFFPGCLDFLQYSKATYTHTLGVNADSSRICYIYIEEQVAFNYELTSSIPIDLVIARASGCTFNDAGEPVIDDNSIIAEAYGVSSYSRSVTLGQGTYALILSSDAPCSDTKIITNIKMDCVS